VENNPVNQGFHLVNSNYFLQFCCTKANRRFAWPKAHHQTFTGDGLIFGQAIPGEQKQTGGLRVERTGGSLQEPGEDRFTLFNEELKI
jgi:hypothetical protein